MEGEARVRIEAPPQRVWAAISDVTRMGEWSPECYRGEWLDGATGPTVGARFRGYNKRGLMKWSTVATVTAAEPGREFAFVISPGGTIWRYRFEPAGEGTGVTESFQTGGLRVLDAFYTLIGRKRQVEAAMRSTLERVKAAVEAG
jgi:uncharacterized protein YndB with AHSA1/START domain